ncbi:MAG UNVERIFIED_CONTAM: hypothetical protein LVQ98_06050 [Rickettsiaceae bacterium]|jgi:hypothetical protein
MISDSLSKELKGLIIPNSTPEYQEILIQQLHALHKEHFTKSSVPPYEKDLTGNNKMALF